MKKFKLSKKQNKTKISPLTIGIIIIEVVILACVSTYAWFTFGQASIIRTDIISVEPDSGLEIDFNTADDEGAVDINQYIENFEFEPVTSLDGRNIFVPTTGTFANTQTNKMAFREATVNDMNSKYINIDFTLTNTNTDDMDVYLSSKSTFKFNENEEGKALRIALYQNDGTSGAVKSELGNVVTPDSGGNSGNNPSGTYTVYLKAHSSWTEQSQIKCHVWKDGVGSKTDFPGEVMTPVGNGVYSYTFSNTYDELLFCYKGDQNQTADLQVYDGGTYSFIDENRNNTWALDNIKIDGGTPVNGNTSSGSGSSGSSTTEAVTVYFNNSLGWETPYAYIWKSSNDEPLFGNDGDNKYKAVKMTHVSGDIYYHTFPVEYDKILFLDSATTNATGRVQTEDTDVCNGHIYYIGDYNNSSGKYNVSHIDYIGGVDGGTYPVISPGVSAGFQRPYAPVINIDNTSGAAKNIIPAYASAIDNYSYGSKKLFSIGSGKTITLSMIIWLEGTDSDCTKDVYSGKDIDLNFIFATSDSNADPIYTYKFIDKTKESWIDGMVTTDTGISFYPVMQLYDVENGKGYLMKQTTVDGVNVWTVNAPQDLKDSGGLSFRRVNPLNENEIWNYWDTDGFSSHISPENDVVAFTAFADGAPTSAWDNVSVNPKESEKRNDNLPELSCGGLWGDYSDSTNYLYVFDGTETRWLPGSEGDDTIEGSTAAMTINYELNGQHVEYKASADNSKGLYYFIVPDQLCDTSVSSRPDVTIKRYYDFFEGLALNDPVKNSEVKYHNSWNLGAKSDGFYYQITDNDFGYWGNDMLYVESTIDYHDNNNAQLRVIFFKDTYLPSDDSIPKFYSKIYKNDAYKGDSNFGYACVIPNNEPYNKFIVERTNNSYSEVYNRTSTSYGSIDCTGSSEPYNITTTQNIIKLIGWGGTDSDGKTYMNVENRYNNDNLP